MENSIEFFLNNHLGWALSPHNYMLTFVIDWFDNQKAQKSEVRQVAKYIVKSKVYSQTYSP